MKLFKKIKLKTGTVIRFFARTLCTEVFLSKLHPHMAEEQLSKALPVIRWLRALVKIQYSHTRNSVGLSISGIHIVTAHLTKLNDCEINSQIRMKTAFRSSFDGDISRSRNRRPKPHQNQPYSLNSSDPTTHRALEAAFCDSTEHGLKNTRAVVIYRDGEMVGEGYASGVSPTNPLLGYSLAKTFTQFCFGVLEYDGLWNRNSPLQIPAWTINPADPRNELTFENLFRMTSGLSFFEDNSGTDPVSQMLFFQKDMAAYASSFELSYAPGTRYEYSSGNTILLCERLKHILGGDRENVQNFITSRIKHPLALETINFEFDSAGTPIGSTYAHASARDWARLGQVFLNNGAFNNRTFFHPEWLTWCLEQTLDSEYGIGLRSCRYKAAVNKFGFSDIPEDTFFGYGFLGQYLVMIPSRKIVVARLGMTRGPVAKHDGMAEVLKILSNS